MEKFWMVIAAEGSSSTTERHKIRGTAEAEAHRLTIKEGKSFVVLEAISLCSVVQPVIKTCWHDCK